MIKSRNTNLHKTSLNNDEVGLIMSEIMEKCDAIEQKLDLLIAKQDEKLCQCDDEILLP
tara:strand:- start:337 stop:513 length:177 start_codon:yes stop_codon:yes gene_type:complete